MKFYKVVTENGPQLVGTQAEVKALKQALVIEEVPTDKDGLAAYVNALLAVQTFTDLKQEIADRNDSIAPVESEATRQIKLMDAVEAKPTPLNIDNVVEFVLDTETYHFSTIFGAVMERIARIQREFKS